MSENLNSDSEDNEHVFYNSSTHHHHKPEDLSISNSASNPAAVSHHIRHQSFTEKLPLC